MNSANCLMTERRLCGIVSVLLPALLPLVLLLALMLWPQPACASPQRDYTAAREAYHALLKSNSRQQYRHHWERVLEPLATFARRYPQHARAADACYLLGQGYEKLSAISHQREDLQQALSHYQRLFERYPASSLADDALLHSARIQQQRLADSVQARQLLQRLLRQYPRADMAAPARTLLAQLGEAPPARPVPPAPVSAPAAPAGGSQIEDIRYSVGADHTRLVVELSGETPYQLGSLSGPPRFYLDLAGARSRAGLPETFSVRGAPALRAIRQGKGTHGVRLVCDFDRLPGYQVFTLTQPFRIVVDFSHDQRASLTANPPQLREAPASAPRQPAADAVTALLPAKSAEPVQRLQLPPLKKKQRLRIVVDAGHGGKDPGAVGAGGLYEKDITLSLAKKLAEQLRQQVSCEVLLTRERDVYLTLQQRTAFANEVDADLFVSIHANASLNKAAYGTETFFLNFSKNDKAIEVAARENGMSLKEVSDLELILFDLMANAKINESSRLATEIQQALVKRLRQKYPVRDLGVKQGPFHVLLGATMPSVLVEVAFISHAKEASYLKNSHYQAQAVLGISQGVANYLRSQNLLAER
ncbi:N-acetylmuramoyl-L-alanine amidase [Desulfuromonas thiophila]|uniref:N-acetylmuramoyl-L-alanine amidase n=1 Tax=Desulfuromonas thiophila TaxID=57664 RepID=UPI0024A82AFF|nr:N-acetylmuramoyl-L-alanine amidase [Desulfuromonas thiophila]